METKTTKLEKQVSEIINGKMTVAEKLSALNNIDCTGRPGAENARKMMAAYKERILEKKNSLGNAKVRDRRRDRIEGLGVYRAPSELVFHGEVYNAIYNLVDRTVWSEQDSVNVRSLFTGLHKANRQEIKAALKKAGKMLKPLMLAWKVTKVEMAALVERNKAFREAHGCDEYSNYTNYQSGTKAYTGIFDANKFKPCIVGDYTLITVEDEETNWNYYSKAWHNAHGPKVTVTYRGVRILHKGKEVATYEVDAFRAGYAMDVLAKHLGLKPAKVGKELKHLQPSKWIELQKSVKRDGAQLYKMLLAGEVVGYVAEDNEKNNYHGDTIEETLKGLQEKIAKMREKAAKEVGITYTAEQLHNRFGFCYAGMTEFCRATDLDIKGTYTLAQLREAIMTHNCREIKTKYFRELRKIAVI